MSDTQTEPNYQDILDKYAASLKSTEEVKIPDTPEPEPEVMTDLKPEVPTPILETPIASPLETPTIAEVKPEEKIEEEKLESGPESVAEIPESLPPKENNFFKYLFFFSLFVFIIVFISIVISIINSQKSRNSSNSTPIITSTPTETVTTTCEINGKHYQVNETFTATDGCNSCSCDENLQISCTTMACEASSSMKLSPTSVSNKKTYENKVYNITFQYPASFSVSDQLPKTKISSGPKTALELTDSKNNYRVSIMVDPDGFGPIFADKKITLGYSSTKGLFSTKVVLSTEEEKLSLDENIKSIWYQFDNSSFSNLTIITNAPKADTKLETITNEILSSFKFL